MQPTDELVGVPHVDAPVEEGVYEARLVAVSKVVGQYGAQVKFEFELLDDGVAGRKLAYYTPLNWSLAGKMLQSAKALRGGVPVPANESFSLQSLVGCRCRLVVRHKTLADGRIAAKVDSLLAMPRKDDALTGTPQPSKRTPVSDPTPDEYELEEGDPFAP